MSSVKSQSRDLTRSKRDGQILRFDAAQPGQQRVLYLLVLTNPIDRALFLDGHECECCGWIV